MVLRFVLPICLAAGLAVPATAATGAVAPVPPSLGYTIQDHAYDPVAAAIEDVVAHLGDGGKFVSTADARAIAAFYADNGFAPVWVDDDGLSERARAVAERLRAADLDGLRPRDYPTPPDSGFIDRRNLAKAEVMLSYSAVTYARHAYTGRLEPKKLSSNFGYDPHTIDPAEVLHRLSLAQNPVAELDGFNPQHDDFQRLRMRLAEVRADDSVRPPFIPDGRYMQLGKTDKRVPLLREHLKIASNAEKPELFDEELDLAIRAFQEESGLTVDGIVGPGTLGVLNQAAVDHESTILVNMERWRWMPKELGNFYVRVNVPNFNVEIHRDGEVYHETRIVVGKPQHATPIFSDEIEHVIVNPTWHVPASIARNELIPAARRNAGSVRGYQVLANINGRFQAVDPTRINWSVADASVIRFKQPPGTRNALGRVKFMFPNKYAVYLHDTPSKSLFNRDYRAYSHGCMRVHNPFDFADALLLAEPALSGELLRKKIGGREQQLNLDDHIPVHITYFTSWVDDSGKLQIRGDIYGHDKRMKKALGLG